MKRPVLRLVIGMCALLAAAPAQADDAPRRIASINLCTDQLLLALADPQQIIGLSPYARDSARAWFAGRAADFPVLSGAAEDALMLKPDLVVGGRFTRWQTRELLRAQGVRVEDFDVVETIDQAKEEIIRFGALVGHPDRAARAVAAIDDALARAKAAALQKPLSALALQRRGWVSGERTLMNALLDAVGLRNAGAGADYGRLLPLESIVALQPDLLVVTRDDGRAEDQGRAMLLHPAIAGRFTRDRLIILPERLTVCGGVMLADALDEIARQIVRFSAP